MPWDIKDRAERRREFLALARTGGCSFSELCRRFGVSRRIGYKWRKREKEGGEQALGDQPPRLVRRANQTPAEMEAKLLAVRTHNPSWGPRKLRRRLQDLGEVNVPAVSSVARLLRRCGCISPQASAACQPWQRFERANPNELWQMDFKGHFALSDGGRCHPLTVLDDHSRYLLGLFACGDERHVTVQDCLTATFTLHGLPGSILCDNGPPWAGSGPEITALEVWLLRLGVRMIHGRPFHPQTQGKDERFHRTLKADLLERHDWPGLVVAQTRFDAYRRLYNHDRPHDALGLAVPASRYQPSARAFPAELPQAHYDADELTRPVKSKGEITFRNRFFYIGRAFAGLHVALRPVARADTYRVCYAASTLGLIDLSLPPLIAQRAPATHSFLSIQNCHPRSGTPVTLDPSPYRSKPAHRPA